MTNDERWNEISKQAERVERNFDMGIITQHDYDMQCLEISNQIQEIFPNHEIV